MPLALCFEGFLRARVATGFRLTLALETRVLTVNEFVHRMDQRTVREGGNIPVMDGVLRFDREVQT